MTQSEMIQRFVQVQASLNELILGMERSSIYAAQSAAFRDLKKWAAKADRVKLGLTEMKL